MALGISAVAGVRGIQVTEDGSNTRVRLTLDRPIPLKTSAESSEIFIVEGFSKADWNADEKGSGEGDVKEYYVEEYSSGSGELVIRTTPGARLKEANMAPADEVYHYDVIFESGDGPAMPSSGRGMLIVNKVQVGRKGDATRMVFYLNRPGNFHFNVNASGSQAMIIPDERMRWEAQTTMSHPTGLFKGYELIDRGDQMGIKISMVDGTKIGQGTIQDATSPEPKYVIDLMPDTVSDVSQKRLFDKEVSPEMGWGMNAWGTAPAVVPSWKPDPGSGEKKDTGLVRSMDILTQNDDTIIKFVTKEPLNFDVTENDYTNQVIVHLPKISWMDVDALDKNGGLIDSYKVDQSSPGGTNLVLSVRKGTHVIGKKTVSGGDDQVHRFIIHLNQNENKTPEWLVEATTEKLTYEEDDREEVETTQVVYRGGVTPNASIGQGMFAGWNAVYMGGEGKISGGNSAGASRRLYAGSTGIAGEGYVGFGQELVNGLYVSGDIFAGHYLMKQTRTFKNGNQYDGEMKIGFNWGMSMRVGSYVSPMALLYGRLGVVSTDFWFKGTDSSPGNVIFPGDYSKRNRTGFLYGVGIDTAYNDYTSIRFEANQLTYQSFMCKSDLGNNNVKYRFILNQFAVGMTHHFRPMSGPSAVPIYEDSVVRGLYGGGSFSLNNVYARRDFKNTTGGADIKYHGSSGNSDPVWGFYGGYGHADGRFYYAGEAQVTMNESVIQEQLTHPGGGGQYENFRDSLKWRWGVVGRLGYILNHGVMGYGKLGFVSSKFTRSYDFTAGSPHQFAAAVKKNKNLLGMRLGGGLEVAVNRVIGIRGDWTLDYYPKVSLQSPTEAGAKETQAIIDNRFGIGLTVYLSDALAKMGLGNIL